MRSPTRSILLFLAITPFACTGGSTTVTASSPDAAPVDGATVDTPTTATTALALGSVTGVTPVSCGPGNSMCEAFTVSCPGVPDLTGKLQITMPANVTRTVVILGPGGGTYFYDLGGFVAGYTANGFRVVQISWDSDWEAASPTSITAAACRTSTMFHFIKTTIALAQTPQPFCVHGSSGGSGALAYGLARYGLASEIDHAMFAFGPVFSRMDYGCAPDTYSGPALDLCPTDPSAFYHYTTTSEAEIDMWEGTQGCSSHPDPSDIDRWQADSTMTADAVYDYPHTSLSFHYCVSPATGGAGQGAFFIGAAHGAGASTVTCYSDCPNEKLSATDITTMVDEMAAKCVLNP